MVRGQKSKMVPVIRQAAVMTARDPSPDTQSPASRNKAAYGEIMNQLSRTKSRIFKVC